MRAIDADHLRRWILSRVFQTQLNVSDVIDQIDREDTIEPERKKGKWIKHVRGYWTFVNKDGERDGWIPDSECSECGSRGWKYAENTMNFCPNCGAYMREETDAD